MPVKNGAAFFGKRKQQPPDGRIGFGYFFAIFTRRGAEAQRRRGSRSGEWGIRDSGLGTRDWGLKIREWGVGCRE